MNNNNTMKHTIRKPAAFYPLIPLIISLGLCFSPINPAEEAAAQTAAGKKKSTQTASKADKKLKEQEKPKEKKEPKSSKEKEADAAKSIMETLEYGINKDRKTAINRVLSIKDTDLQKKLSGKLINILDEETDPEVSVRAITVLGDIKESRAVPGFIKRLDDNSEDVRTAAVYGLKNLNAITAKEMLIKKLEKEDLTKHNNFTEALINILGTFKAKEMIPFTQKAIENEKTHSSIREYLVLFLGNLDTGETKTFLLKLYKNEDEELPIRSYAVNSLAKLKIKEVTGDIKEVMGTIESYNFEKKKQYYSLYMYSVAALASLGDHEAIPKLMNSIRSDNAQVRLKAVMMLKDLKTERTIDILKYRMKNDPNQKVRRAARSVLKEFGVEVGEEEKNQEGQDSGTDE